MPSPSLMPLAITSGWTVRYNAFYDIPFSDAYAGWFDEDLLWMKRYRYYNGLLQESVGDIDLGWYPSEAPDGTYALCLLGEGGWDDILVRYTSRDRHEIATAIALFCEAPVNTKADAQRYFLDHWPHNDPPLPRSRRSRAKQR